MTDFYGCGGLGGPEATCTRRLVGVLQEDRHRGRRAEDRSRHSVHERVHARDEKQNNLSNGFGQISVQTGTEVGLRFSLQTGDGEPQTPERVDFAMYDFDKGSNRGARPKTECMLRLRRSL